MKTESTKNRSNDYIGICYLKNGQDVFTRWIILLAVFFVFPMFLVFPYICSMAKNGGFLFLVAFMSVFAYCVKENGLLLYRIASESDVLRKFYYDLRPNVDFGDYTNSILANHVHHLNLIWRRSGKNNSSQDSLIEILHAKLKNEGSIVVLASNIMITLGLIGTISGLISSIGGLQSTSSVAGLMGGITKAIDGMGVAFYSTLIGSMLGGITLRILHFYVDKQVDAFVLTMAEVIEVRVIPALHKTERKDSLRDVAVATLTALREMNIMKGEEK